MLQIKVKAAGPNDNSRAVGSMQLGLPASRKETADDHLYGAGVRHGPTAVPGDRRSPRNSARRACTVALPEACDRGFMPDPSGRWEYRGLSGLPGTASSDARPYQGWHTFRTQRRYRRGGGAGDLDELEVRLGRAAVWRRQGWRDGRSTRAVASRA